MNRLDSLRSRLALYLAAETAILDGAQSYNMAGKMITRANLAEISANIKYLEKEIATEESRSCGKGRNKAFGIIPRDL